jgi:hypothetical protein
MENIHNTPFQYIICINFKEIEPKNAYLYFHGLDETWNIFKYYANRKSVNSCYVYKIEYSFNPEYAIFSYDESNK